MRVLILTSMASLDSDFPLVREFQRKGIDVYLLMYMRPNNLRICLFDVKKQDSRLGIIPGANYPEIRKYENYMDISKVFVANRPINGLRASFTMGVKTFMWIRKLKPDVIHSMSVFRTFELPLFWFRKKVVMVLHDPFPHSGESSKIRLFFNKLSIMLSGKIVLLNDRQKADFQDFYKIDSKRLFTNRFGELDCIRMFSPKEPFSKNKNILCIGRFSPYKGYDYMLRAMVKIHEQVPEATLTIAGGGKPYFDITPYEKLDYIKIVNRYIGLEEMAYFFSQCRIVSCTYTDGTQSGVVSTAYAMGKPVVGSDVGGIPDFVKDGINGRLVKAKDLQNIIDTFVEILSDETKLEYYKSNVQEAFKGEQSWSNIADKYINIIYR